MDVMGRWNIRCRVLGKGLRFVDVMGRWNIRCRVVGKGVRFVDVGDWISDIGFWEKR